jgi:uncharacterized phage protein (TIGR01671 family)
MEKREIKFRVWDGEKMLRVDSAMFENGNMLCMFQHSETEVEAYLLKPDAVMQFTGLKDKNGKEIYEGDIVRFVNAEEAYDKTHTIEWKHNGFLVNGWTALLDHHGTTCEVIGNIYENPELLTNN